MEIRKNLLTYIIIIFGGLLLFATGIGRVHLFDWDEINFAESAREMLITGDYLNVQINFETFWEKPPLFIWMQALSMKVFGINEFAARFPNSIAGILTLLTLFLIGKRWKSASFGRLWALLYACSFLPFFYFKSGIIDPWFNLFIFLGIYFMMKYTAERCGRPMLQAILSAFFLGLATLTKGPVGFLIFLIVFGVFLILKRFRLPRFRWKDVLAFLVTFAFIGGLWFIFQLLSGNKDIIWDFIIYQIRLFRQQDAGHGGFPFYHFVILFFGVFPASVFALPSMRRRVLQEEEDKGMAHFFRWMMITLWVVLILFSIVRTKIVHYSSMCYFPITFLAAWYIARWMEGKEKPGKWLTFLLLGIAIPVGIIVSVIPFVDSFKERLIPYIQDEFAVRNLEATSSWIGFEWLIGLILIGGVLQYVLSKNHHPRRALLSLLGSSLLFIYLGVFFFPPQIEAYSQRAAIEFLKDKAGEECYIYAIHKSYAIYFYAEREPRNNLSDLTYLQEAELDKPAYFILKNQGSEVADFLEETKDAVRLYEKNGFVFYARYPHSSINSETIIPDRTL